MILNLQGLLYVRPYCRQTNLKGFHRANDASKAAVSLSCEERGRTATDRGDATMQGKCVAHLLAISQLGQRTELLVEVQLGCQTQGVMKCTTGLMK